MAELNKEIQTFIVQQLAMYQSPQEVADSVKENFEIEITRQQINNYDPSKPYYNGGKKWRDLFARTRENFLQESAKVPIMNKSFRAAILQKLANKLLSQTNGFSHKLMLDILEHAAKEEGGMFTNRRELTGANGKDLLPADIAKAVFQDLIKEGSFTAEEAMEFVKDRYQVEQHQIISEANN